MDAATLDFIRSAGSVLVAFAVLCGAIYLGHRYIYLPSQKQSRATAEANAKAAEANADAAKAHAKAAQANEQAARFNAVTSEANARTAGLLERLAEMFLDNAKKK